MSVNVIRLSFPSLNAISQYKHFTKLARVTFCQHRKFHGLRSVDLIKTKTDRLSSFGTSAVNGKSEAEYTTVDADEVDKFSRIAQTWWNTSGEFAALHSMNELRIPLIRDALSKSEQNFVKPLTGLNILDVGCGGGILSEPLARLGANVTGIDASYENISMAKYHANLDPGISGTLTYECTAVEDLSFSNKTFDAVVASEIIEHVSDRVTFVSSCCNLVKPGGSIFFTTINRTVLSRVLAVFVAENILGIVPKGAHDWEKFIPPEDLQFLLTQNGLDTRLVHGMLLNPCTNKWQWIADTSMNYALHATKPASEVCEKSQ